MPTTVNHTYNYTGFTEVLSLPWNVTGFILIIALGASGSSHTVGSTTNWGGNGGRVIAYLDAASYAGQNLYFTVGGCAASTAAGFNGGGAGWDTASGSAGGGGGGASDVRLANVGLSNRILVAAGGGGACAGGQGGDGGANAGEQGHPQDSRGGRGGTQSAGGAGGTGPGTADDGIDGTSGKGGRAGHGPASGPGSSGGGGGGGYYGGGGGGADNQTGYGGGGGGGSNYISSSLAFAPENATEGSNERGEGGSLDANGVISISYTVLDPVTAGISMGAQASIEVMHFTGPINNQYLPSGVSRNLALPVAATGRMTTAGFSTTRDAMAAHGSLTVTKGPSSIFGGITFVSRASLVDTGFRSTSNALSLASIASLFTQQSSSSVQFRANGAMTLPSGQRSLIGAINIPAHATLSLAGFDTPTRALAMASRGSLVVSGFGALFDGLTMASHASVSLAGRVSELTGVHVYPRATLTLSGRLTGFGHPVMAAVGRLSHSIELKHTGLLNFSASTHLTIAPSLLVFVGPAMASHAELRLGPLSQGSPVHLHALAAMLLDLDPSGGVYDAPYLIVTDTHNTVQFFVRGYPTPGQVRQAVTNVGSGF